MATLKLIFGLGVLGAVILLAVKVVPPYFSNYEFEDAIKTEALHSTYSTRTEDDIREAVVQQALKYDIELKPEQVHVKRLGQNFGGTLAIDVEYSVPIDLLGYSTTLEFHPSTKNRSTL